MIRGVQNYVQFPETVHKLCWDLFLQILRVINWFFSVILNLLKVLLHSLLISWWFMLYQELFENKYQSLSIICHQNIREFLCMPLREDISSASLRIIQEFSLINVYLLLWAAFLLRVFYFLLLLYIKVMHNFQCIKLVRIKIFHLNLTPKDIILIQHLLS